MAKMRRTSLFLDPDVVEAAQRALGTKTAADTVRRALDEVNAREVRRGVRELELELTLDDLRRLRGGPGERP